MGGVQASLQDPHEENEVVSQVSASVVVGEEVAAIIYKREGPGGGAISDDSSDSGEQDIVGSHAAVSAEDTEFESAPGDNLLESNIPDINETTDHKNDDQQRQGKP
jgi:hypothetical protein